MSIFDTTITRIYKCSACEAKFEFQQKVTDDFETICPLCNQPELLIESAKTSISTFVDQTQAKTFGTQAEKNTERMKKEGTYPKEDVSKVPFYRPQKKINYKILQNPSKYISTGRI